MSDTPFRKIEPFQRGVIPKVEQMEGLRTQVEALADRVPQSGGLRGREMAYVQITQALAGVPWYSGKIGVGDVMDDGTNDLDLAAFLTFPPFDDILIFNIAEIGGTHSLEAGDILRGFYAGRTPDGEKSIVEVNPGGGGEAEEIPAGEYVGMALTTTGSNSYAWSFLQLHSVP